MAGISAPKFAAESRQEPLPLTSCGGPFGLASVAELLRPLPTLPVGRNRFEPQSGEPDQRQILRGSFGLERARQM
jgi:hypothetical protein